MADTRPAREPSRQETRTDTQKRATERDGGYAVGQRDRVQQENTYSRDHE